MKLKEIPNNEELLFQGHVIKIVLEYNKIKLKYIRKHDKASKQFQPPSKEDVMTYFFDKGYESFAGAKAWEYYTELNWHDKNGVKVKNWKAKMIQWFSEDIKRKPKQEDAIPKMIR